MDGAIGLLEQLDRCTEDECSHAFLATEGEVVLTASTATFSEWGGDCAKFGSEATCTLPLDGDHDATAGFSSIQ
jgi:hypothetical protein